MTLYPPVERMDLSQMIARGQYWSGWCIDNELDAPELVRLRHLLNAVVEHLKDERDAQAARPITGA